MAVSFIGGGNRWWFMVYNATFNNISVSIYHAGHLVEESGIPGEKH
jgi:hypothetical protein